ncbi:MAG: amidohydrolase family protein [Actinomycetota bacterium]|nr:amidohydrolase family protein [Actinomycetota bacterium]MED5551398.1 amidohydrolase family protein [Actinomycetota bacterium]MEE2680240.1 amidohydrolase family protein [Actinomycetota bacterium]MEE3187427.1 amidohydrolase family protein [Actinomycetota bacterium]|tara:strand:+ start:1332 stop:2333 length:1002 start_codon:yes stop_codon:yes gene_type:complete
MDKTTWLAATIEEPVDSLEEIVDPHHHLWDFPTGTYLLPELHQDTGAGHNVTQTVFVECGAGYRDQGPEHLRPVGEIEFVRGQAELSAEQEGAEIAAIVGFADLTRGEAVEEVLEAQQVAGGGRFRGIRHANAWDASDQIRESHTKPPAGLLGHSNFRAGFAKLGEMGFSFDAWMFHPQVKELVDLAASVPETPIVLDHLGGPLGIGPYAGIREEVRATLRPALEALAQHEQVVVKVGGIGMSIYGVGLNRLPEAPTSEQVAELWSEDIRHCVDTFGPERCMFESNFPVDRQGCSYTVLFNAFQRVAEEAGWSSVERAELFSGTARRFYRLNP